MERAGGGRRRFTLIVALAAAAFVAAAFGPLRLSARQVPPQAAPPQAATPAQATLTAGVREAAWSPDGKRLAVTWYDAIWTMTPDGKDMKRLVPAPQGWAAERDPGLVARRTRDRVQRQHERRVRRLDCAGLRRRAAQGQSAARRRALAVVDEGRAESPGVPSRSEGGLGPADGRRAGTRRGRGAHRWRRGFVAGRVVTRWPAHGLRVRSRCGTEQRH